MRSKFRSRRGASLIEYLLIMAVIIVPAIPAIFSVTVQVDEKLWETGGTMGTMSGTDSDITHPGQCGSSIACLRRLAGSHTSGINSSWTSSASNSTSNMTDFM